MVELQDISDLIGADGRCDHRPCILSGQVQVEDPVRYLKGEEGEGSDPCGAPHFSV